MIRMTEDQVPRTDEGMIRMTSTRPMSLRALLTLVGASHSAAFSLAVRRQLGDPDGCPAPGRVSATGGTTYLHATYAQLCRSSCVEGCDAFTGCDDSCDGSCVISIAAVKWGCDDSCDSGCDHTCACGAPPPWP